MNVSSREQSDGHPQTRPNRTNNRTEPPSQGTLQHPQEHLIDDERVADGPVGGQAEQRVMIESACTWPLAMSPPKNKKRLVPHPAWTQDFTGILLILSMTTANEGLRRVIDEEEVAGCQPVLYAHPLHTKFVPVAPPSGSTFPKFDDGEVHIIITGSRQFMLHSSILKQECRDNLAVAATTARSTAAARASPAHKGKEKNGEFNSGARQPYQHLTVPHKIMLWPAVYIHLMLWPAVYIHLMLWPAVYIHLMSWPAVYIHLMLWPAVYIHLISSDISAAVYFAARGQPVGRHALRPPRAVDCPAEKKPAAMRELLADQWAAKLNSKAIKRGVTGRFRLVLVDNQEEDDLLAYVLEPSAMDTGRQYVSTRSRRYCSSHDAEIDALMQMQYAGGSFHVNFILARFWDGVTDYCSIVLEHCDEDTLDDSIKAHVDAKGEG